MTVQKTAVIEPQDPDYAFEIVSFTTEAGKTYTSTADNSIEIPVMLANADYVSEAKFDLTLPEGFGVASYKSGIKTITKKPEVASNRSYNVSEGESCALVVNQSASGNVLTSTGDGDFVLSEGSGELCKIYLTTASTVEPGVYTIKIDNISITSTPDGENSTIHEGGEYLASVIVGQPSAQEVILYGHYTDEAVRDFNKALKNVAVAEVSALAPYNEDFGLFEDVIMNFNTIEEESFSLSEYQRTSPNYATTVLPYELTSTDNVQFYTVKEMTASSIVIEEAATVDANTPCIFKGTLEAIGSPVTSFVAIQDIPLGSTTFKGTYEATSIDDGAGYYISSNGNFYSDGASVRPFRAYFKGVVDNNASKLRVLLNTETGVEDITNELSDEAIYTLQGVRVNNAQKGINIKGGKKVYVK